MPNWCNAIVKVKGKAKDVKSFCKLFIYTDEVGIKKEPYFARSFNNNSSWKDFKSKYIGEHKPDEIIETEFMVDFAWSAYSCLVDGYPQEQDTPTLESACKKHKVEVEIDTEEPGMGFEERLEFKNGMLVCGSRNMKVYKCLECGSKEMIASSYDLDDYECSECGKSKWRKVK